MASSNIKLFDENKGNMLSDSEFSISNQRMNGLQTGVASSQLQNKAMYQASLIAYAIAQVMMQNGKNANDTDAVSAFVANLSGTMLQKVYDIATTEEAKAGVATGKWMSPALVKAAIDKTLSDNNFLQKSGGTMTGNLILNANPTANLGAATKQYVDTNVNNVKSALTPVFGDLPKNGYFKLGDMSVGGSSSSYFYLEYKDLYSFVNSNIGQLSEIVILIRNSYWRNTSAGLNYLLIDNETSVIAEFDGASAGANAAGTVNMMRRYKPLSVDFTDGTYELSGGKNAVLTVSPNKKYVVVKPKNSSLQTTETSIGAAEIWYK